jgi:hypothetical protein
MFADSSQEKRLNSKNCQVLLSCAVFGSYGLFANLPLQPTSPPLPESQYPHDSPAFLVWPVLSTHCRCWGWMLGLVTLNDTHTHTVGLPWMRDRSIAETSTTQHKTQETDNHVPGGIRTCNPSKPAAADSRLRPHGHQYRPPMNNENSLS